MTIEELVHELESAEKPTRKLDAHLQQMMEELGRPITRGQRRK